MIAFRVRIFRGLVSDADIGDDEKWVTPTFLCITNEYQIEINEYMLLNLNV